MPSPPLTHHEIIGLVEPFSRHRHRVDLDASDRHARRLAFKPSPVSDGAPPLLAGGVKTLALENPKPGLYRLARTIELRCGLQATLETEGTRPGELLERIEAVPAERQFRSAAGVPIALSYYAAPLSGARERSAVELILMRAAAQVHGLMLTLNARVARFRADLALSSANGDPLDLPDDLLAVLGWRWGRLRPQPATGWSGPMHVRGREPARSRQIERRMETAVAHLSRTLSEPPRRFHERMLRQRWAAALRRALPLATVVGSIAGLVLLWTTSGEESVARALVSHVPVLMLGLPFVRFHLPPLELPPVPQPPPAAAWPPADTGPGSQKPFDPSGAP